MWATLRASLAVLCGAAMAAEPEDWNRLVSQGVALLRQGHFAAARTALSEAVRSSNDFPSSDRRRAIALSYLGNAQEELALYGDAERSYKRALDWLARIDGRESRDYAAVLGNLAGVLALSGRLAASERTARQAVEIYARTGMNDGLPMALARGFLADALVRQNRLDEAESLMEQIRSVFERELGPQSPRTAVLLNNFAVLRRMQGRHEESARLIRESLAIVEARLGPKHPQMLRAYNNLATAQADSGDLDAAGESFRRAIALAEENLGKDHPTSATIALNYAQLLRRIGSKQEARTIEESSQRTLADAKRRGGIGTTVDVRDLALLSSR